MPRLDTAARKGKRGGRPPVITDDMLHTVLRRRAGGEAVEQIRPDLVIPTGKRKGQNPSWRASTGRSSSTASARQTPKPSSRPTPTSPTSAPQRPPAPTGHRGAQLMTMTMTMTVLTGPAPRGSVAGGRLSR
ncbi:hypothetical protein AB0F11_33955 [Streptomyces sp. NPDC032472]|uniref:hypothetical protein n=1 Tax=Streptomyces sp. NPDC032472 TaxID=3155018 RepID=UPI0033DD15CA